MTDEKYMQKNYFISKDIITIPYSSQSSEYGLPERINIKHLKEDDKNYNKTFIKDYFDFIQNFPNEQYLTNISFFNWWFEHKSKLFYKINDYKPVSFKNLLNKTRGVLGRKETYTSGNLTRTENFIPEIEPPDGWTWRSSSGYGGKHYYLDTLDIEKDFEIKSQFFLIKFDKEHSMYLPFPKGLFALDKSIYYTRDNYHYIKEMYEDDWETIQFDIDEIEKYLNVRERKNSLWEDHFKYALKWKRDMFIMFEILSKKSFTIVLPNDGGFKIKGATHKEDKRRHDHYDKFKSEKEKKDKGMETRFFKQVFRRGGDNAVSKEKYKQKLLKEKLDELMKSNYLENIKEEIIKGENTTLEKCKEKFEVFTKHKWSNFIKVLDIFLQGTKGWTKIERTRFNIKSIEIKDIYFENVSDFTNPTDLIKRNITLGEVEVPCVMYPRPLKPPSWWNNTWIRCPLDKSEERNERKYVLKKKGINVYQDTYDAWYLKDEYIENVIKFYNLKYKITSLEEFEKCLKKKITVNEDIDEMYPEFDEDKSEKNVVKEKKHKIIIKQEKFVEKIQKENEIIATLLVNYNGIKDIFKQVSILQDRKELSITQYEQELKNQGKEKLLGYKTVQTKDTMELLILFLLWGNKEFNEPKYFRKTSGGKINTYWYKDIYDADDRTWVTLSKNQIKKLKKKEIGRIWYNLYQKIEEFDLLKRKDTKSNYVLEVVIKQFEEKDFNTNFKSIKRELFKKIKDEAHIYLNADDKKSIINYFDYLKIHYQLLKQNLLDEEDYLKKLNKMKPEQLDKEASSVAIGSSKKKKEKLKPKITAEQEIKLDIVYNKYKGEHKYLTNKWRDFINDATSTLVKRTKEYNNIVYKINTLEGIIKKNKENFNKNSKNYMPTKKFMNLKKQITIQKNKCEKLSIELNEKLKRQNILQILKKIEKLKKNLGIAINEHDKHRTGMKRKVTYPDMVATTDKYKEALKEYDNEIKKIEGYQLMVICNIQVKKLEDKIKTSFSQYIEDYIMKPTRWLREREERRDWLLLLINQNQKNKLEFSRLYKKQYEKLRNLYFNMNQIQDRLIVLKKETKEIDELKSEMKEFQKKYKRFKAEEHYFT